MSIDRKAERWLLLTFYALIILTIAIEVFRRFVINYSSPWGEEVARYAFIYLAWMAAAAAVRDRAHIRIDVLVNLGGPKMKRFGWWLADIATLVLAVSGSLAIHCPNYHVAELWLDYSRFTCITGLFPGGHTWLYLGGIAGGAVQLLADVRRMKRGEPVFDGQKLFD